MPSLAARMKTAERPGECSIETTQSVPAWDCGTTNLAKVIHNFRHRAQDRLRAFECPQDCQWQSQSQSIGTSLALPLKYRGSCEPQPPGARC
jgi:hypothetical protein